MFVELVHVTTADGLRLDGALRSVPEDAAQRPLAVDAFIWVHGTGSNFYGSSLGEAFSQRLVELGAACLLINTRGHDLMSTASTVGGGRRAGAAYERIEDCRHDVTAWVDFLANRGLRRVGLVGHSLGAVKCIYALAHESRLPVVALVAVSPPRLSHALFANGAKRDEFLAAYEQADRLVRAGRTQELIESTFPLPYALAAEAYLDKYGPHERYNVLSLLPRVTIPTLVTFGSVEVVDNLAFQDMPKEIERLAADRAVEVAMVAGADHFYAGARDELIARVEAWLRRTLPV